MPYARGKRVALAAVAVGLLLIVGAGLTSRDVLIKKWQTWKDEKRTRQILSTMRMSCAFRNRPLPEVLQFLSDGSGAKVTMSPEASRSVNERNSRVTIQRVSDVPLEGLLRSVLVSADPDLEYTVKGDTVVIGLRAGATPTPSPPTPPGSQP